MSTVALTLVDAEALAAAALEAAGTSRDNARCVAVALVAAEADGHAGHGLARVPSYAGQARSGKVNGRAVPECRAVAKAALRVEARDGFAFPALALAVERLRPVARDCGIAVAAIANSHHFGAAGYHVEALARGGLAGLMFGNSPQAIAPWGGAKGIFGTNPIAFAAPRRAAPALVIDLSLSKVARGRVMAAAQKGETIPEGWALDAGGRPTADPTQALAGTMLPMGEAKGAVLAMMVEILAAALTASHFGYEASSFFTADGPPPRIGQLLLALDPGPLSAGGFADRLESLIAAILAQPGTRLPGDRRLRQRARAAADGVSIPQPLYDEIAQLARA